MSSKQSGLDFSDEGLVRILAFGIITCFHLPAQMNYVGNLEISLELIDDNSAKGFEYHLIISNSLGPSSEMG